MQTKHYMKIKSHFTKMQMDQGGNLEVCLKVFEMDKR